MRLPHLTIVPVQDMHYSGQLVNPVRNKYRNSISFSGLPVLLQLKSPRWNDCLTRMRDAFVQQHNIELPHDNVLDLYEWGHHLNQLNRRDLVVLRLLEPSSSEILSRLIQWASDKKQAAKALYVIAAVDQQLLERVLIQQQLETAGKSVDIYIHDGSHDNFKQRSGSRLWFTACLGVLAAVGWWWFDKAERQSTRQSEIEPVVAIHSDNQRMVAEADSPQAALPSEIWDYHVESDWLRELTERQSQQPETNGTQASLNRAQNADDNQAVGSSSADDTATQNAVVQDLDVQQAPQPTQDEFIRALENNDFNWLDQNAASLMQWRTGNGDSALALLAERNHLQWVRRLLAKGASPNISNDDDWTPLLISAISGHVEIAEALLVAGADPNRANATGRSALMAAVHNRHHALAELLMAHGAEVNQQGDDGWAPLFYAVWNKDIPLVRSLLDAGADLDLVDSNGTNVRDIAGQQDNQQMLAILNS